MNLQSDFVVARPLPEVWDSLLDVEGVAPCIPGFALEAAEGEEFRGKMKVKIGAITMTYRSTVRFAERDDEEHRVVIAAKGQEVGGQGSVEATVVAALGEAPAGTRIDMDTDLAITGRVAQFGRGIIADVSDRLVKQFVTAFEARLEAPRGAAEAADPAAESGRSPAAASEPVDVVGVAAWPLARRLLPVAAALLAMVAIVRSVRR